MQRPKIKLNVDWESLLPGDFLNIGGQEIPIHPLGLKGNAELIRRLRKLSDKFGEAGITWQNWQQPSSLIPIADIVLSNCPDLLSFASGIEQEDIERLPLEYQALIINKVIEVNTKSRDTLEKNFKSLATTLAGLMGANVNLEK